MGFFDRMKGTLGRNQEIVGDLADDSWGEVPETSPASYLMAEATRRVVEAYLPEYTEDEWEVMLKEAQARERREEQIIRVPRAEPPPEETDWDALLARAKARSEVRVTPAPVLRAPTPVPAPAPTPAPVAKSAMKSEPFSPSKMAIGTVPPQSRTATAPASKATTFLPAPRPARRDDEWETALARAKAASTSPAAEPTDPWEAAIRKAKTSAA